MSSANEILISLANSLGGVLTDVLVEPFIIPASQLLQMDDLPLERVGISFDGTTQGVNIDTGREFQDELLRIQLFFALGDKKGDKELVEAKLNDSVDLVTTWYKSVRNSIGNVDADLVRFSLLGKRSITRSNNYYEQFLEFRVLRSI